MSDITQTNTHAPSRVRGLVVIGAITSALVGAGVFLALGASSTPEDKALDVVRRLESALDRGDFDGAHALVDYRFRLAEALGELWETGDSTAQTELERLTREMLVESTEKRWPSCCHGRQMQHSIMSSAYDVIWVESKPVGPDAPAFLWRYRLNRRQQAWRITQRDYLMDRVPTDTARFWPMARKAVAMKLGRDPNLSEFQANLLSVMPTLRVRTFFVPELPPKTQSPKRSDDPGLEHAAP